MPSSVIHGMRYLPGLKALDIVFRSTGETYRYFDVTGEEWREFKRAPSKGTYLNVVFKANHPRMERFAAMRPTLVPRIAGSAAGPRDLPDENVWGFYENSL